MGNVMYAIILFILGTIFGSFGGVLISRKWDKEGIKSIFFGRSKCDNCKKTLSWYELIPIVSFVIQRGKCKNCGTKLPNFYWIIEVIMGIVFVLTYAFFPYQSIIELCGWIAINWGFTLLILFDIQKYELHSPVWYVVTAVSIALSLYRFSVHDLLVSGLPLILTFIIIYFFGRLYVKLRFNSKGEGIGLGDVYLATTIGILAPHIFFRNQIAITTMNSINITLIFIITSCLIGLMYVGIERLVSLRKDIKIPFIPSMIIAFRVLFFSCNLFINMFR